MGVPCGAELGNEKSLLALSWPNGTCDDFIRLTAIHGVKPKTMHSGANHCDLGLEHVRPAAEHLDGEIDAPQHCSLSHEPSCHRLRKELYTGSWSRFDATCSALQTQHGPLDFRVRVCNIRVGHLLAGGQALDQVRCHAHVGGRYQHLEM